MLLLSFFFVAYKFNHIRLLILINFFLQFCFLLNTIIMARINVIYGEWKQKRNIFFVLKGNLHKKKNTNVWPFPLDFLSDRNQYSISNRRILFDQSLLHVFVFDIDTLKMKWKKKYKINVTDKSIDLICFQFNVYCVSTIVFFSFQIFFSFTFIDFSKQNTHTHTYRSPITTTTTKITKTSSSSSIEKMDK